MCTYKRLDLLPKTLQMLESQIDKGFDLYIWNNNQKIKDLDSMINTNPQVKCSFQIMYHNSPENVGGIGRFYYTKTICDKYGFVIFIDDDQIFDKHFILTLREEAKPNVLSGWWAYRILGNYNQRERSLPYQEADYVGTGGMICPTQIFGDPRLYEEIPKKFIFIEDLWLSFFAKLEHKYILQRSSVNLKFFPNESVRDQYHSLGKEKVEFHKYLLNKYMQR